MQNFRAKQGTEELRVFTPKSTEDTAEIITYLKNSSAVVSLKKLRQNAKQRVIDILTGGGYALDMSVCMLEKDALLIVKK